MTSTFEITPEIQNLRQLIAGSPSTGWEKAWVAGITPWDAGHIQPPLESLLRSGEVDFPRAGKALVPGCGKGYDPIFIASFLGLQTTGFDISPTAVALANETLRSNASPPSNVKFELGDFFHIKDTYDLVYDYTFFQALPPSMRPAWGKQMSSIVQPGGYLILLGFPTDASKDKGPPYGIDEDSHAKVLGEGWEKLIDRIPDNSSPSHVGRDRLIVLRKL
ncbi:hypothetical protein M422DRAFT_218041 [Sphaerobolus stellatus SS14]|nr:hypothetical protein M422DRAFT_218041 [Sphaerobolus stellatus SS14]